MSDATVAVYAHFDPGGRVAPHVRRALEQVAGAVDAVVVVSTADLGPRERAVLSSYGRLIVRENTGYDFYSWKTGIDTLGDLRGHQRLVLCNDSVVGPLIGMRELLAAAPEADVWSTTASAEIAPHLQSWFTVYESAALEAGLVRAFWRAMTPESHRYQVIRRYEVGQSRLLQTGGLRTASWFVPDRVESVRAEVRHRRWLAQRAKRPVPSPARLTAEAVLARPWTQTRTWNPCYACWDSALTGRLPYVKLEAVRDDPVGLDSEAVLTEFEQRFPVAFAGVRDHLDRTRADMRRLRRVS